MKKAGQILKEMGFKENAPDSLKEAFVRHLIKAATGYEVAPGPSERRELASQRKHVSGEQLSFDFSGAPKETDKQEQPSAEIKKSS